MNKKKIIIWTFAVLAALFILWLILKKPKEKELQQETVFLTPVFPLKMDALKYQEGVKNLQRYLNKEKGTSLTVDGVWGAKTQEAVTSILKRDNISSDVWDKWRLADY